MYGEEEVKKWEVDKCSALGSTQPLKTSTRILLAVKEAGAYG
jgi:hypothetical protein